MEYLLRHQKNAEGVNIVYGDNERSVMRYLDQHARINLDQAQELLKISRKKAAVTLTTLVRGDVLQILPSEHGDFYALQEAAFV